MPALARLYVDPTATAQSKGSINIVYEILNAYMGGIGELSGVSLFAVIWLALTGISLLQKAQLPKWVAYFGFVAAASLFFNLIELLGINPGPMITISVVVLHFWMFGTAAVLWNRKI